MRVFVTGAAGFIGYHVSAELAKRGHFVIGLDNFNSYYSQDLKRARAQKLREHEIEIHDGDICDSDLLRRLFEVHNFTHVIHLAAQAGVRHSLTHPKSYVTANIEGFINLLEICKEHPTIPIIYASSSSVYGRNSKVPFSITDRTDCPANVYGATKKADELIAHAYHHLWKIPLTGLRYFTVYGPFGRPDMAYFSFTKAIIDGKPIPVFNEGKMERDFTYIDDIVDGTIAAAELASPLEIFNLGNSKPQLLSTFIAILETAIGKKAIQEYLPMQPGDMVKTYADIDHSTNRLGFNPKVSLETGLNQFVQWYKTFYG